MQSWILYGLAAIFLINAFWLIFMGNYTDRSTAEGRYRSYEFEKNPIGYSLSVGLILTLGFTCLHFANPALVLVAVKKVPQLGFVITVAKGQNGLYYLLGGGFVTASILAFIFRRTITSASTFSKGHELDLDPRAIKAHKARVRGETPDWQREGERKMSQFDDGTPLS